MIDPPRSVASAIVEELVDAGVTHAFTVPGESFLPVLDALRDSPIRVITTRHEGGAGFMAEGFGKVTRRPAVVLATLAVGAANLAIAVHTAAQDSTPLLALLGQVRSCDRGREAFQEIDLAAFLGTLAPYAVEPASSGRLPAAIREALRHSTSVRPAPACVALREDLLREEFRGVGAAAGEPARGGVTGGPAADTGGLREAAGTVAGLIGTAERPVLLLGADVVASGCGALAGAIAQGEAIPVLAVWRRPDSISNDHPNYLGMAGLSALPVTRETLAEADLWVVVGDRLDENTLAGYSLPRNGTDVVHAWLDEAGLEPRGRGIGIPTGANAFLTALAAVLGDDSREPDPARVARVRALRSRWERESTPVPDTVGEGYADQFAVAAALRRVLPRGTITVTDAGNFSGWTARYLRMTEPGTFLGPVSGAMGYAVPAAVGAKLARPDRPVVAFAGDGGFLMTAAELQTAAREGIDLSVVVFDNERYNTIRMHQERHYPGRPVATTLGRSDLAQVSRGLGAWNAEVSSADAVEAALIAALAHDGPAVVVVRCDPEQLAVGQRDPMPD